jgi:hypothetical protein
VTRGASVEALAIEERARVDQHRITARVAKVHNGAPQHRQLAVSLIWATIYLPTHSLGLA